MTLNLNPSSPFTGTPLNECSLRELDAWIAYRTGKRLPQKWGIAGPVLCRPEEADLKITECITPPYTTTDLALSLMATEVWPLSFGLFKAGVNDFSILNTVEPLLISSGTAPLAICRAWIIAIEAKEFVE